MVALASDFDVLGPGFLTRLTAVLVAILRHASTWQVRALCLFIGRHHHSPYRDRFIVIVPSGFHCIWRGETTLPSFHRPADECSGCDAYSKRHRNS
jgi:hypothetical protein